MGAVSICGPHHVELAPLFCRNGTTPLIHAADMGLTEVCNALTARGANVDAKEKYGRTALTAAADAGHFDVAQKLVECKVSPSQPGRYKISGCDPGVIWGRMISEKRQISKHPGVIRSIPPYETPKSVMKGGGDW